MSKKYEIEYIRIRDYDAFKIKSDGKEFLYYDDKPFLLIMDDEVAAEIYPCCEYYKFKAEIELLNENKCKYLIIKCEGKEAKITIDTTIEINFKKFTLKRIPKKLKESMIANQIY